MDGGDPMDRRVAPPISSDQPRDMAGPRARPGRHSAHLPPDLLAKYERARQDPELLSLREDVALLDAEIHARLEGLRDGELPVAGTELRRAVDEVVRNQRTWDWTTMATRLEALSALVDRGLGRERAFTQVRGLIDQKARLARQEHKRLVDLEQLLTVEEALLVAAALTAAVRRVVGDKDVLEVLEVEFRQILSIEEQ